MRRLEPCEVPEDSGEFGLGPATPNGLPSRRPRAGLDRVKDKAWQVQATLDARIEPASYSLRRGAGRICRTTRGANVGANSPESTLRQPQKSLANCGNLRQPNPHLFTS